MSAVATARPFVTQLRTPRGDTLVAGEPGGERMMIRAQFEPLWDAVAVDARADATVESVVRAMLAHFRESRPLEAFVVKLRGFEVTNAASTLADCGVRAGSTLHVHHRYRRPVR